MLHNSNPKPSLALSNSLISNSIHQMDKPLAIHDKKTTKPKHRQNPQKPKKNQPPNAPVKVVYIGNPVNFNTSASQFRSLVQQLTGKGSCSSNNSVGGRHPHQESSIKDPESNICVPDNEAEEIASSSSLNCPTATSDHNSNFLDVAHQDDGVFNTIQDQMLDDYLPPDFWYDQY